MLASTSSSTCSGKRPGVEVLQAKMPFEVGSQTRLSGDIGTETADRGTAVHGDGGAEGRRMKLPPGAGTAPRGTGDRGGGADRGGAVAVVLSQRLRAEGDAPSSKPPRPSGSPRRASSNARPTRSARSATRWSTTASCSTAA